MSHKRLLPVQVLIPRGTTRSDLDRYTIPTNPHALSVLVSLKGARFISVNARPCILDINIYVSTVLIRWQGRMCGCVLGAT
jgi:hypothetical protein